MIYEINSPEEFEKLKHEKEAMLVYFSHNQCNVCKVLKPKIETLLAEKFPLVGMFYVNTESVPVLAGQERVFTVPSLLVFFDGREYIRKSRNIGLQELENELERYYKMLFG